MNGLNRWIEPWTELGLGVSMELQADLRHRYSEPHRAYHNLHHIAECLQLLAQARELAARANEVELALWFHDAIYDPRKSDNEALSAEWARREIRKAGGDADLQQRIVDLVMVTKHDGVPQTADEILLCDIDLSILGAGAARFDEYEQQIRSEYKHVPTAQFRPARRKVMTMFLDRERIYETEWFRERREAQARKNIARSLARLSGKF